MYKRIKILLPLELYGRDAIRASTRISNPGCYATSSQLLLGPLVKAGLIAPGVWPTVFGISGFSGAGTVAGAADAAGLPMTVPKVTPESLQGGIKSYSLTDHIHEREAGRHLARLLAPGGGEMKLAFVPSVAPWFSGILSVLSAPLSRKVDAREVKALYEEMYGGEALIRISASVPTLPDVENKQGWSVGGFQVHSSGERVVIVVRIAAFVLGHFELTIFCREDWTIC